MSDKRRTKKQKPVKSVKTDSTDGVSISIMQAKPQQTGSPCNRDNFLHDIFNNIDDGLSILDTELNIIHVNKWIENVHSEQMPLVGKKCYKAYQNRKSPCFSCPSLRVLKTGLPQSELSQCSAYKNTDTWFDICAYPLKNDAGQIVGIIEHIRDISKHMQARRALEESEEKFKNIFKHANDGIAYLDCFGRILDVNDKAMKIFAGSKENLLNRHFTKLGILSFRDIPKYIDIFRDILAGKYFSLTVEITDKKGKHLFLECNASKIKSSNGPAKIMVIARDITERKKVEEELRESEEKFRALAEHSPDTIMRLDLNYRHIYVNPAVQTQTKIPQKDFLGKTHHELGFPKELCTLLENTLEKVFNTGQVDRIEFQIPSGHWIDWFVVPEFEPNGRIKGVLATGRDITEHKKHEALLRTSETQLSLAANIAKLGYWEYNIPEKLFHFNDQFYSIFRTTAADVGGYSITEKRFHKLFVCPEDRKFVKQTINSIITNKQSNTVHNIEHRTIFPDGQTGYVAVRFFYVTDNQSRPVRTFGIIQDITENKLAQEKLVAYQQKLRSLESELSLVEERQRRRIASDLHDHICQTLVLSKMKFQELKEFLPKEKARDTIEICNTLSRTIDSVRELIFDISSPTLYKFGLESALKELLEDKLVAKSGIAYKFYCDGTSKPLTENVCIILFSSVREILINIIKHAKARKVNLAIEKHNDSVRIIIIDDGIGFDVDNAVTTPSWSGSFGLFNIKERLNYIDGGLEIYSKPGYGSKFILSAPIDIQGKKLKGK